jgi:hypothetical protein
MQTNDQQNEVEAIVKAIADESTAFWNKDFEGWAQHWVHAPYVRSMGWTPAAGVSYVAGWDTLSTHTREYLANDPIPNPNAARVRRENFNIRIYGDSAWVTFDQYGEDTGKPSFDMPGRSRETRILEKQDGGWKFVYVGWLLEGTS